jgi:hypothetical protein
VLNFGDINCKCQSLLPGSPFVKGELGAEEGCDTLARSQEEAGPILLYHIPPIICSESVSHITQAKLDSRRVRCQHLTGKRKEEKASILMK